jgi:hypothetical protein
MKQSKPLKLKTIRSATHIKEKETKKEPDIKVDSEEEQ